MWPFKKKEHEKDPHNAMRERLEAWRSVGEYFTYLSIRMRVTSHYRLIPFYNPPFLVRPCIQADYVDKKGVLHHITFDWQECEALMRDNPIPLPPPPPTADLLIVGQSEQA